ncbi:MAG: ATP-binding protein [Verrucomicrobia bacterium]|nr:ATP-binding protein [Verrucomicrobiota bacterium]
MNGLIGMTSLLQDSALNPVQRNYVRVIHQCGQNLLNVINDILDFSKIEAGKLELEKAPFQLSLVLRDALELMRPRAAEKRLLLDLVSSQALHRWYVGDAVRVGQIVLNLISNAIKFTDQGFVRISANNSTQDQADGVLYIVVEDSGMGIPEDKLPQMFQAFFSGGWQHHAQIWRDWPRFGDFKKTGAVDGRRSSSQFRIGQGFAIYAVLATSSGRSSSCGRGQCLR